VLLQMVLHYAEDAAQAMAEARRVLAPGGLLVVVDLAAHDRAELRDRMAHRALGFDDTAMGALLAGAGLHATASVTVPGKLTVRIWASSALENPAAVIAGSPGAALRQTTDHFEVMP